MKRHRALIFRHCARPAPRRTCAAHSGCDTQPSPHKARCELAIRTRSSPAPTRGPNSGPCPAVLPAVAAPASLTSVLPARSSEEIGAEESLRSSSGEPSPQPRHPGPGDRPHRCSRSTSASPPAGPGSVRPDQVHQDRFAPGVVSRAGDAIRLRRTRPCTGVELPPRTRALAPAGSERLDHVSTTSLLFVLLQQLKSRPNAIICEVRVCGCVELMPTRIVSAMLSGSPPQSHDAVVRFGKPWPPYAFNP